MNKIIRILGIIGSLILPFVFIFDRLINHVFFSFPGIERIAPYFLFFFFMIALLIFLWNLILFLFLFYPYYYSSWKKEPSNVFIKYWAKLSSVVIPIYFFIEVSRNVSNLSYIRGWTAGFILMALMLTGLFLLPIYIFAWGEIFTKIFIKLVNPQNLKKIKPSASAFNWKFYFVIGLLLFFLLITSVQGSVIWECKANECDGIYFWIKNHWGFIGLVISSVYALIKAISYFIKRQIK